ncbi:MAG TPA: DUF1264 domain-containing protein [Pirellulales bacterium]|nr:DUF1264 domain-containing protein [Pirellulales bacterium]
MRFISSKRRIVVCLGGAIVAGVLCVCAVADVFGTQAKKKPPKDHEDIHAKGPIAELMKCPLAFAGVHLMNDDPSEYRVAYHYCKTVHPDLNQCVLYDGTGPDARLIGIEYLVSDAVYQKMPEEEKIYWHDHKFEVDEGLLKSLTQSGDEQRQTLAQVRTMWGKVYHTWVDGKTYPRGPARLFWSVTGKEPFVLPDQVELPAELRKAPE